MARRQPLHPYTALINQEQRRKSKEMVADALKWLSKKFPDAFDNKIRMRPLKKGIMQDVLAFSSEALADGISISKLRQAVVVYTRRLDYLICLKSLDKRVDLDGNFIENVSLEEGEQAALKIKRRIEKILKSTRKPRAPKRHSEYSYKRSDSHGNFNHDLSGRDSLSYVNQNLVQKTRSAPAISIKKPTRNFDPEAVARFREKLGLSKKAQEVV
jgi:ProP effector